MKIAFPILFWCLFSGLTSGQGTSKNIHFGFSFTPQLGNAAFNSKLVANNHSGINYLFSGDVLINLSPKTQFITGLILHDVKLKYRDYSPQFPGDVENGMALIFNSYWDFNYSDLFIGLPVRVKLKLNSPDKLNHFFFKFGLTAQRLLINSGYVILNESGYIHEKRGPDEYYFDFQKTWLVTNIGLGYEFKLGKGKFSIQPEYEYSLSKIFRPTIAVDANGRLSFLGIQLAYDIK
ncbi:MAG: hypothetical protein ABJB16_01810 [Saprospiraceae bacterium]